MLSDTATVDYNIGANASQCHHTETYSSKLDLYGVLLRCVRVDAMSWWHQLTLCPNACLAACYLMYACQIATTALLLADVVA